MKVDGASSRTCCKHALTEITDVTEYNTISFAGTLLANERLDLHALNDGLSIWSTPSSEHSTGISATVYVER